MPIPSSVIGTRTPPLTVQVERGRLRLFAKATGETDAAYVDVDVARAQGHRDLPVPPTYLFGLELERPDPFGWITDLGVDLTTVLHGSQGFDYRAMAYAGDALTVRSEITNVYMKKGGALEFLERSSQVSRDGEPIATLSQTTVIRRQATA